MNRGTNKSSLAIKEKLNLFERCWPAIRQSRCRFLQESLRVYRSVLHFLLSPPELLAKREEQWYEWGVSKVDQWIKTTKNFSLQVSSEALPPKEATLAQLHSQLPQLGCGHSSLKPRGRLVAEETPQPPWSRPDSNPFFTCKTRKHENYCSKLNASVLHLVNCRTY